MLEFDDQQSLVVVQGVIGEVMHVIDDCAFYVFCLKVIGLGEHVFQTLLAILILFFVTGLYYAVCVNHHHIAGVIVTVQPVYTLSLSVVTQYAQT